MSAKETNSMELQPTSNMECASGSDDAELTNDETIIEFSSLNDECIHNIFDWLSIYDLCRLKVTCKRLYLLAKEHYQRTYIQTIATYNERMEINKYHKSFLRPIPFVIFSRREFIDGRDIQGLAITNYPKLKHFFNNILTSNEQLMKSLFNRNPNIRAFSSDTPISATNMLLNAGIKVDDLVLRIRLNNETVQVIENLNVLHKKQQIKSLHLKIHEKDFILNPRFGTLTFLESIETDIVGNSDKIVNALISLPNLKFLICYKNIGLYTHHFDLLAQNLGKLEEFHTDAIYSIDGTIPFVRYSANLKCIYLQCWNYCNLKNENTTTTLRMLDKKRRQLQNACKLTIYMHEVHYLHMKNISSTSSHGLVEIKRTDSYPLSRHPIRPQYTHSSCDQLILSENQLNYEFWYS